MSCAMPLGVPVKVSKYASLDTLPDTLCRPNTWLASKRAWNFCRSWSFTPRSTNSDSVSRTAASMSASVSPEEGFWITTKNISQASSRQPCET